MKQLLSNSLPTFAPPSGDSRTAFDSKTAAINITPSSSHQYDIETIKENALWLSGEANIDELEALRLTILEWQYRPEARLKTGFSDAELASLRDVFGAEYCESAGLIPGSPLSRSEAAFDSPDGVRTRLLQLYSHEKVRLLAVAEEMLEFRSLWVIGSVPNQRAKPRLSAFAQPPSHPFHDILIDACQAIGNSIEALQSDPSWPVQEQYQSQLIEANATSNLQCVALYLDIILLLSTHSHEFVSADALHQWLHLMQSVDHFASFQSDIAVQQTSIEHIRTVSASTTLSLLQPTAILEQLAEHPETRQGSYIYELQYITELHEIIAGFAKMSCVPASLGVLSWGLLLVEIRNLATEMRETAENRAMQKAVTLSPHEARRSSISSAGSSHQSIFDDILREISPGPNGEDPADFLLTCAVQRSGVLDYISQIATPQQGENRVISSTITEQLQDLVKQALPVLGYSSDLLSAQNAILTHGNHRKSVFDPSVIFIRDPLLMESIFEVAAARFPYEALPFLRLCKSLARACVFDLDNTQYISFRLRQLDSFTQLATQGFSSYHTIREDENANLVALDNAVGIFDFQQHNLLTQNESHSTALNIIPAQAVGEVISESTPPTIRWQHTFSGFALLGKWVELHREGLLSNIISTFEDPDDVVAEVIRTLVALLENTCKQAKNLRNQRDAQRVCDGIMEEASALLQGDIDLIGCIFELSEHQLQAARGQTPSIASRDLLAACVDFFTIYAEIHPTHVWPLIMRSSIFGMSGAKRNALTFIGGVELPVQTFKLLESCSRFFRIILNIALPLSIQGMDIPQSVQLKNLRLTASQRLNSSIISNCTEVMLSALEAMGAWEFQDQMQKQWIFTEITQGFYVVIYYAFGTGEKYDGNAAAKTTFMPAASSLIQALQNPGLQGTGAGPLLHQITAAVVDPKFVDVLGAPAVHTKSSIHLIGLLLQYSQMTVGSSPDFESKLISLLPVLVRASLSQPLQSHETNTLIHSILKAIPPGSSSSILGHLGAASSISWIDALRHMYSQPQRSMNPSLLWQTYSQLVTLDQQWLAIVLVTGKPPGRQQTEGEAPKHQTQGEPCLQLALRTLSTPNTIGSTTLAGLLDFLLEAQRNWPSVSNLIIAQSKLFPELIAWVCKAGHQQQARGRPSSSQ